MAIFWFRDFQSASFNRTIQIQVPFIFRCVIGWRVCWSTSRILIKFALENVFDFTAAQFPRKECECYNIFWNSILRFCYCSWNSKSCYWITLPGFHPSPPFSKYLGFSWTQQWQTEPCHIECHHSSSESWWNCVLSCCRSQVWIGKFIRWLRYWRILKLC